MSENTVTFGGIANDPETLKTIVGRTIRGILQQEDGSVVLIFDDGALVFGSLGGGSPTYWTMNREAADRVVKARRDLIARYQAELAAVTAIPGDRS